MIAFTFGGVGQYVQSRTKGKETFFYPPCPPISNVDECEKNIKIERTSFSVRITYISTSNKGEKGDPKKVHNLVQDCLNF